MTPSILQLSTALTDVLARADAAGLPEPISATCSFGLAEIHVMSAHPSQWLAQFAAAADAEVRVLSNGSALVTAGLGHDLPIQIIWIVAPSEAA